VDPGNSEKVMLKDQWTKFYKKITQEFFVFLGLACMSLPLPSSSVSLH
jgi:hypothetical protein